MRTDVTTAAGPPSARPALKTFSHQSCPWLAELWCRLDAAGNNFVRLVHLDEYVSSLDWTDHLSFAMPYGETLPVNLHVHMESLSINAMLSDFCM